tara:strand:- start:1156 stop:1662 length:507 start_codon:yes stop_codon:yes gene_type:complete
MVMPPFFDRYIQLGEDIELLVALEKYNPEALFENIGQLEALKDKTYAPNKWTIKDILQHVIDNERIMAYRALRFSRKDATVLPGYEEALLASHSIASQRTITDLMDEFRAIRNSTNSLFKYMSDDMLLSSGNANGIVISALSLGYVIVGHAIHHQKIIIERYLGLLDE